jgi:hypothetical protein
LVCSAHWELSCQRARVQALRSFTCCARCQRLPARGQEKTRVSFSSACSPQACATLVFRPRSSQPLRCKTKVVGDEIKRPSLRPGSPRARSSQGRRKDLRLCSQAATRALSSTCARGGEEAGERRRGGVSRSSIRVEGWSLPVSRSVPHALGARWRLYLGELRDHDAPELVNVARVDPVRVCRVAELLRANHGAKQTRPKPQKRVGLFGLCLFLSWLKNTREFFQHEPATMLIAKGSRVFVSRLLVLSQFAPSRTRRARGLWRVRAPRPSTAPQPSTAQPLTLHAGALQVAPRSPSLTSFSAPRAAPVKARVATARYEPLGLEGCEHGATHFLRLLGGLSLFLGEPQRGERAGGAVYKLLQRAAWAGGENFKTGLERRPRRTAYGSQPEHQDIPRLSPPRAVSRRRRAQQTKGRKARRRARRQRRWLFSGREPGDQILDGRSDEELRDLLGANTPQLRGKEGLFVKAQGSPYFQL